MTKEEKALEYRSVGERCSLDEFKGTIHYVGEVPPTKGFWYGVEWDDERGKHDGTLDGTKYFQCRDKHGSFVRPHKVTCGIDATSIIEQTYGEGTFQADEIVINEKSNNEKVIQMVGFEKVALQQSDLMELKEADISRTNVSRPNQERPVGSICPKLTYLNLRRSLISSFKDVVGIAGQLKFLEVLNISENKINSWDISSKDTENTFVQLQSLYINTVGINWSQLVDILEHLPTVSVVHACFNPDINDTSYHTRIKELKILNLEGCQISSWDSVRKIANSSRVEWLILNNNQLKSIECSDGNDFFPCLGSLSLNNNLIDDWMSVNELRKIKSLKEFRLRNNPVCKDLTSFQLRQELIARLEHVNIFNGSKVENSERKVAEIAYVKKYCNAYFSSKNDENALKSFQQSHPRYYSLVEVYGEPLEEKSTSTKLKEALLSITIECPDCDSKQPVVKKIPATITVQQLRGIIQRALKVPNTKQKLSYLDRKNSREIELDDKMKQLTYYSISDQDIVYVRW